MGRLIEIVGAPGSGKTASLEELNPDIVMYINADGKDLPFKNADAMYNEERGNYRVTSNVWDIQAILSDVSNNMPEKRIVVIDTINAVMMDREMSVNFRSRKKGDEAFGKWTDLAAEVYDLCNFINDATKVRKNLLVYMMCHEVLLRDEAGIVVERKLVTNGRKLEKISLESKATIVLFTKVLHTEDTSEYFFETQGRGVSTAKSPKGMFELQLIPNNLKTISKTIAEYYAPAKPVAAALVKSKTEKVK